MKLSMIIPVLNEEGTVLEVVQRVLDLDFPGWDKEIVVVNDGSTDRTEQVLAEVRGRIIYLKHDKNQGKGAAIVTALEQVSGEAVVIQDADLEYNPEEIGLLLENFSLNRAVYGSRNLAPARRGYSLYVFGVWFLTKLVNLFFGSRLTDVYTCYKLFPSDVIKNFDLHSRGFEFEMEVTCKLLKQGVEIVEVPISYSPRRFKEGKKIRGRDGLVGIWVMLKNRF